jgi:mono/diheme cytochrome c family protein
MKPDRKKGQAKASRELHPPARSRSDDPEPSVGRAHLPFWIFIVLAIGLFWSMVYLDNYAGGFNPKVYQRFASSNELVSLIPFDPERDLVNKGYAVYNRPTCVACHQANGLGTPPTFPPLAGSEWVLEKDPARIIRIVLDGMKGPVMVKGQPYGSAVMTPWRSSLNDEEIAQVLTYIRKSWGNNASVVTAQQVATVRKDTATHTGEWTAAELEQVKLAQ